MEAEQTEDTVGWHTIVWLGVPVGQTNIANGCYRSTAPCLAATFV